MSMIKNRSAKSGPYNWSTYVIAVYSIKLQIQHSEIFDHYFVTNYPPSIFGF